MYVSIHCLLVLFPPFIFFHSRHLPHPLLYLINTIVYLYLGTYINALDSHTIATVLSC